jgi:hypothetical protein
MMKTSLNSYRYGVWIDRKHAIIIKIDAEGNPEYTEITSGLGTRIRFDGETTTKTGMLGTTLSWQKKSQEKENNYLRKFITKVVSSLQNANAVLILGSADTRFELQNAIEKSKTMQNIWIENRPEVKLDRRGLELEMEKHFNLHFS